MAPLPENTEAVVTEDQVETTDPVVDESLTKDTKESPTAADVLEVEKDKESDETATEKDAKEEKEDEKQEETPVEPVEKEEDEEPKTREEIRNAFDPFFDSSKADEDTDKIAKESADATKELASLFS